jgi:hypothetical protein
VLNVSSSKQDSKTVIEFMRKPSMRYFSTGISITTLGIEISSVPNKILAFAEQEIRPIQKDLTIFVRAVYLLDVFEMLMPQFKNALEVLSLASWLCIFRHWDRHSKELKNSS